LIPDYPRSCLAYATLISTFYHYYPAIMQQCQVSRLHILIEIHHTVQTGIRSW